MSAEEKVIAIKDVMERARKDWREAQMQVMNLYTEIENDMSVITPNLSVDIALFACEKELYEDAFKTLARSFIAVKNDESPFSIMDIMRQSMLYKLFFLIDEQNLTEDNFFQKTLAIEVTSIKKDRKYKKNIKDKAQKLLVSLCNREIDLCLSIVYDKSKEIEEVVEGALHGHRREMEYSEFRYLYRVINKWSNQFAESLRFYGVIDNTIDTLISDVTKVVKKHISNCRTQPSFEAVLKRRMKSVSDYKSLLSYYRSFYPLVLGIEKYRYMHEATNSTSVLLPDEGNQENALEEVIRESQDFDADSPKLVSLQQSIESDANIPVCYVFYSSDEEHEVEEPPAEELNEDIGSLKRLRSFFWACEKNH